MAFYRKKPVVIEVIKWDGLNLKEIKDFVGESLEYDIVDTAWQVGKAPPQVHIVIKTLEGNHICTEGDYIIKGVKGEFYPCKPDIFEATYEKVEDIIKCVGCKHLTVLNEKHCYAICEKTGIEFLPFELDTRTYTCQWAEKKYIGE